MKIKKDNLSSSKTKSISGDKQGNENQNYYDIMPKELKKTYHNPNIKKHGIEIPFRMSIIGGSGSGKTQAVLELIHRMKNTFELIVICCKSKHEPLYEFLEMKVNNPKALIFFEISDKESVPSVDTWAKQGQMLIIFDDLVIEKNQSLISEYYIRGRKIGGGISMAYLSQSYFKIPKIIRIQCNYFIIKKLSSIRDLKLILSEFSLLGTDKTALNLLTDMYEYSTLKKGDFLLIDIDQGKFRRNWLEILEA